MPRQARKPGWAGAEYMASIPGSNASNPQHLVGESLIKYLALLWQQVLRSGKSSLKTRLRLPNCQIRVRLFLIRGGFLPKL